MKMLNVCVSMPLTLAVVLAGALTCGGAEPAAPGPGMPPGLPGRMGPPPRVPSAPAVNPVNYLLRVDWKENKGSTRSIQLVTTEGNFKLETFQAGAVKLNDAEFPVSISLSGDLSVLSPEQGRLQFFLGRTVPFVTHSSGSAGSTTIQQHQEGLNCAFFVTFGKPLLIQKDATGEVSVLVEREKP